MKRLLPTVAAVLFPLPAQGDGLVKMNLRLFDSEWRDTLVMEPSGKVSMSGSSGPWSGSLALNLTAERSVPGGWKHVIELDEARADYRGLDWRFAAGRMALRPIPMPFHEGPSGFLTTTPGVDGVAFDLYREALLVRTFLGGAWVGGVGAAFLAGDLGFSLLYRGERSARVAVPVSRGVGAVAFESRAVHLHDWELGLTFKGDNLAVAGLVQGRELGAFRFLSETDSRLGPGRVGGIDEALPRSSGDYRAMTQISTRVLEGEEHEVTGAVSIGGGSAPRYHAGPLGDANRRQGGGNELFLAFSLEDVWRQVRAQAGIAVDRSAADKYLSFSKRTSSGGWALSSYRFHGWTSASFVF